MDSEVLRIKTGVALEIDRIVELEKFYREENLHEPVRKIVADQLCGIARRLSLAIDHNPPEHLERAAVAKKVVMS